MTLRWYPALVAYSDDDKDLEVIVYSSGYGQWYFAVTDFEKGEVLVCSKIVETEEQAKALAAVWIEARLAVQQLQKDIQGQ